MAAEDTARRLSFTLGAEAAQAAALCLEDCRRTGDEVALRYWSDVAARLEGMADSGAIPSADARFDSAMASTSRNWVLMQLTEWCHHRAMQAARRVAGSERHQAEMLDIALQWLDLAQQNELLTKEPCDIGKASRPAHSRIEARGRR